jgi:hypothetical protein
MREPNFFLVGAPKAGTTSLYYYLRQHPDIYMSPIKEPRFFSLEARPVNFEPGYQMQVLRQAEKVREYLQGPMDGICPSGIVCNWPDYLQLFAAATKERAVGEASASYLWSKTAAAAIARRIPRARILMVLRSPAERAFSQYMNAVSSGYVCQSFQDYVRACLRHSGKGIGIYEPFLEIGFYADQVQRYIDHFPREQIGIWYYEDIKTRPREFMREIFQFLKIDNTFAPDTSMRYLEPRFPRIATPNKLLRRTRLLQISRSLVPTAIKPMMQRALYRPTGSVRMAEEDKALMLDFYRNDIHRLEVMLSRDLSLWLR